jgi:hypothetical protein
VDVPARASQPPIPVAERAKTYLRSGPDGGCKTCTASRPRPGRSIRAVYPTLVDAYDSDGNDGRTVDNRLRRDQDQAALALPGRP